MKVDVLIAEIGSTTTILNAFSELDSCHPKFLGQGQAPTSIKEGDVTIGIGHAFINLKKNLNVIELDYETMLATSSAAGGLKMTVHGLVYDMTVKAAKEAALGAGANLHYSTAGKLTKGDIKKIIKINPNIILLAGGVDYGERETALYNALEIAKLNLKIPVVYAGNITCQDEIKDIFEEYGKASILYVVENVYPKVDKLNVEPVRKILQKVFEEHIIHAPGMQKVKEMVTGNIIPTPGAVMEASKLLKEEIGDLVTVDVGGATTDIHSVTEGSDNINRILINPEPIAKRTVEGDLGVYINLKNLVEIITRPVLLKELNITEEELESILNNYKSIPKTELEKNFVERLTKEAVHISLKRHAGEIYNSFTGTQNKIAYGKDLTEVKWIIGTGGALTQLNKGVKILSEVLKIDNKLKLLPTSTTTVLIDHEYIMASLGILSLKNSTAALILLKNTLRFGRKNG